METKALRVRNAIFWALVVIFVILLGIIFGLGRYFGFGRPPFHALISLAVILFVLAIALVVLTAKLKESPLRKTFFILTGASAAAIPICAVLHNVVYGLFFQGKDGDEAVFFILALFVFPALFILGSLGSIVLVISDWFRKI